MRAHRRRARAAVAAVVAATVFGVLPATLAPAGAATRSCTWRLLDAPTRSHGVLGIVPTALHGPRACALSAPITSQAGGGARSPFFSGRPPLTNHGGSVMGTVGHPGQVTVTPIFWDPGATMTTSYKSVLTSYLANVQADSGKLTNAYAAELQYGINYDVTAGTAVVVSDPIPVSGGCTPDSGAVYADNSSYTACVTDAQIQTELTSVLSAHSLPGGLGQAYAVFLPKGVESCVDSSNGAAGGECTVNNSTAGFCAYHSSFGGGPTVYADMPFPSYNSPAPFSCASATVESPNGNQDADVVIDSLSHELTEAVTDPNGDAWFDAKGNEIGDDCVGQYGTASGTAGAMWNETINGAHYYSQGEFSNEDYRFNKKSSCIEHVDMPLASFRGKARAKHGVTVSFNAKKSKGTITGYSWDFGDSSPAGSGQLATHAYAAAGTYTVTLTVTDQVGLQTSTATATASISIS